MRITVQNFFETGRKLARKTFLMELFQALEKIDVTMVSRFFEESLQTGDR
jgi:hypothetical protein